MTTYHHSLNFNIDLLKDSINITDLPRILNGEKAYHSLVDIKENINPVMLEFLEEIGLFVYYCEIFYSKPNFFSQIHIDANATRRDFAKINWVFGGKDSVMNWYKSKDDIIRAEKSVPNGPNSFSYIMYQPHEVDVLHSAPLGIPSVVQVGIPHNIINPTEDRYCIGLALATNTNNKIYRPTMQESLELLSKYLVPSVGFEPTLNSF